MAVTVLITSDFVPSPVIESQWLAQLPDVRQAEIAGWQDASARRHTLLGSRLLAEGLRRLGYTGNPLSSLRHPHRGRPTMDLPVDFSVSHCEGLILCALSTGGPVGVDAERLGGLQAGDFLLYLNAAERAWAGHSARRFYSVWTRKEAVAKAAGSRGLRDLAGVDTTSARHRAMFNGRLWRTSRVPVGRGHMAHLALADAATSLCIDHISAQALEGAHLPTERTHPAAPCPVPFVVRAPLNLS
jgi:4'-phosphopantetheinyl transferase